MMDLSAHLLSTLSLLCREVITLLLLAPEAPVYACAERTSPGATLASTSDTASFWLPRRWIKQQQQQQPAVGGSLQGSPVDRCAALSAKPRSIVTPLGSHSDWWLTPCKSLPQLLHALVSSAEQKKRNTGRPTPCCFLRQGQRESEP
jgi:hypothetical protein